MAIHRSRTVRAAVGLAASVAALVPFSGVANASASTVHVRALPPGVIQLNDSQTCPPNLLCLYRDYGYQGPAYGIVPGAPVDLRDVPMQGGVNGGGTAANEVSSWVNSTFGNATLINIGNGQIRALVRHERMQEPSATNDTVDFVEWFR